jgi:hypothetical protein
LGFFVVTQRFALVGTVHHAAGQFFAFAGTTRPVFATIRQANTLANAGGKQCLCAIGVELTPARLYRDLKAHPCILEGLSSNPTPDFAFKSNPFRRTACPFSP